MANGFLLYFKMGGESQTLKDFEFQIAFHSIFIPFIDF